MLAAVGVGGQLFAPVLEPADRIAAPHSEPAQADFLARQDRLVAEASAHVGRDHANLDFRNLQHLRQPGADDMGELRCAVQDQLAAVCVSHCATKPRHSIGDMTWRAVRSSRVTFTGAVFAAASTGPSKPTSR